MIDDKNDFAHGSVVCHIINLAGPMIVAQLINVLYNIIDRVYIGRIPDVATLAMGGLGLCLPLISIIIAFANLFGMGGAPLCSIARGQGKNQEAEEILRGAGREDIVMNRCIKREHTRLVLGEG